jgi:hypothetical protein
MHVSAWLDVRGVKIHESDEAAAVN